MDDKRLKEFETENAGLKRLLAESILDAEVLRSVLGQKRRATELSWPQFIGVLMRLSDLLIKSPVAPRATCQDLLNPRGNAERQKWNE